jgi:hypothetical protein
MPSPFLSKSDFKSAYDCSAKLYYRKLSYPTTLQDNEYMAFLADSGFMVEYIAKAQFPGGVDLTNERDPHSAFAKTREILAGSEGAVVFEGGFIHDNFYARADILHRKGNELHLIEVKSSSVNVEEGEDRVETFLTRDRKVKAGWKPYLIDVSYQQHVLSLAFPDFKIIPWLWVVNSGAQMTENETAGRFSIVRTKDDIKSRPVVRYAGEVEALQKTKMLARLKVDVITEILMPEVVQKADELVAMLDTNGRLQRPTISIQDNYKLCRKCEYRFPIGKEPLQHGFFECWGELASVRPHILDLHRVGQIGSTKFDDPVPLALYRRKASLLDLREDQLGSTGVYTERRRIQWQHSANQGSEHLPDKLREELAKFEVSPGYPFHFIDFEACDVVLPHHAGLRPYERVAFQWSCHTLDKNGKLDHAEWLNTEPQFPNFKFAHALKNHLGDKGTVLVWSPYEQTTLRMILDQIHAWMATAPEQALEAAGLQSPHEMEELAAWIDGLLGQEDAKGKRGSSPRIRDLHKFALAHYFHPAMLGRTSIKAVLPAVWNQSAALRSHPWFKDYQKTDANGSVMDPYKTLPPLPLGGDEEDDEDVVREGTGAIRIYQELIFWSGSDIQHQKNREMLLKQYCKLDTAAMVMIWAHWVGKI